MRNQKLAVSIAIGAAVVAAGVIFFRSKKGKEILSSVKDAASDASDEIRDHLASLSDKASATIKKGKEHLHNVTNKVKEQAL
ncbi:YtxH domain-containing protein [Deminuibacter soli]|uniref:YtxH domain-containing protein n=1 Tax=Deminuibacter soli TaxID=2291815 RepID=A0A3E1NHP3_9BACT|nr:YtxH domain-containing protein [Deminuibacter soli]RFM27364.1 hypothetical protein DXN05_15205 [Deminuibacter soli]